MNELIFIPTNDDKKRISKVCDEVIDVLEQLPSIEEKAFALQQLVTSFEETANIRLTAIIDKKQSKEGGEKW